MGFDGAEIKKRRQAAANKKDKSQLSSRTKFYAVFSVLVLAILCYAGASTNKDRPPQVKKAPSKTTAAIHRSGKKAVNIGQRPLTFGSTSQAQELLAVINQHPNKVDYSVTYSTEKDIVVIGCNFDKNILARMHNFADGHGTAESWRGHLLYRLESAAAGGSLNDTPSGKSPGTMARF